MSRQPKLQLSLFPREKNLVTLEEYRKVGEGRAKKKQHERKLMQDIIAWATNLGLPCLHIEYFCGNKFYPTCSCGGRAVCAECGKPVLAQCTKRINKGLAGFPDIIGVAWTIETKHKTNKIKPQEIKLSDSQQATIPMMKALGIPTLVVNEDGGPEAIKFLNVIKGARR